MVHSKKSFKKRIQQLKCDQSTEVKSPFSLPTLWPTHLPLAMLLCKYHGHTGLLRAAKVPVRWAASCRSVTFSRGRGSLQPGCPYTPWASPPGESGRPVPLLSPVSPGHCLFSSVPSLPHFLKSDLD